MAGKRITLDGKVLDCRDEYGDWGVHTLEGWWDSPAEKTEQTSRQQADGDYDMPVYYEARYVTITGIYIADSEDEMFHGMNRFSAMLRNPGRLQVVGYGPDQWANVVRASGFPITPATDTVCRWQVRVKAANPRKFGETHVTPAVLGVGFYLYHYGNTQASPVFTITGDMPSGYRIDSNGQEHRVDHALVPGQPHTIDFSNGLLKVNGVYVSGGSGRVTPFKLDPGVGRLFLVQALGGGGTGTISVSVADTYI